MSAIVSDLSSARVLRDRILERVEISPSGCWLWKLALRKGYGAIGIGSLKDGSRRNAVVHRIAYEVFVGPIPEGLTIDHLCRVRNCVNPAHLEPVTNGENVLRGQGVSAQHARKTHCIHGHAFTEANTYIRKGGGRTCRECARAYDRARRLARKQVIS